MDMKVKSKSGVMFSALLAIALTISAPAISYAQPGDLAKMARLNAAKTLETEVMSGVEKKIAGAVAKKPLSDAGKATVRKKFTSEAKQTAKKLIDVAASGTGELPKAAEIVDALMKEILPKIDEFAADITKTEADELAAKKKTETERTVPKPPPEPDMASVTAPARISEPVLAPSEPPQTYKTSVDWTVDDTETWIKTLNGIRTGDDECIHTVTVSGEVSVPASNGNTFGSVKQVKVILEGGGTLSLSGGGYLLNVGAEQTVSVGGTLNLRGRDNNVSPVVVVDGGGTFRMTGSATITGNKMNGDGGGALVRIGNFFMDENSSVSDNTAKGSGGGVFVYDGEFAMRDNAKVSSNHADNGGGGVYIENGKFLMTDAATVSSNTVWLGGGVYVGSAGTFAMRGYAKVSGNTVYRHGGGVYFAGKDFTVEENAAVFGNAASRQGRDVYFAGRTLASPDDAKIQGNTAGIVGMVYFAGKAPAKPIGDGDDDNK
jgi:hypothetical protein